MNHESVKKIALSGMFFCLGIVLPFLTGGLHQLGNMLLPMHLPVFFCGLICGWDWGLVVGFLLPVSRSLLFGMPILYPDAIAMSFELGVYGAVSGYLFHYSKLNFTRAVYRSIIIAMVSGRIVWGVAELILLRLSKKGFTFDAFVTATFMRSIPGIFIQLVLIPLIMTALFKSGFIKYSTENAPKAKFAHIKIKEETYRDDIPDDEEENY